MSNTPPLIDAWRRWTPGEPPFLLDSDRQTIERLPAKEITTIHSWDEAVDHPDFGGPPSANLHLGLHPTPFAGDLQKASVFLLLLNPGLDAGDYYGQYEVAEFAERHLRTLHQDLAGTDHPFIMLDPRFAWHPAFRWWNEKLRGVIAALQLHWKTTYAATRRRLSERVAAVELFPYHSGVSPKPRLWRGLPSSGLAQNFVQQTLMPRVKQGDAIVIVTRQANVWSLQPQPGLTVYSGAEARAAHLTPSSPGGRAILDFLMK